MPNYRLELCYDGSRYNGWQRQGNTKNTIQEKLEAALSGILGQPVEAAASGRTDAGVHARRQVVSFRAETDMDCGRLLSQLRHYLPADMGAPSLEEADSRFHARLSCREKTYLYRLWTSPLPCVFPFQYRLQYPEYALKAQQRCCKHHHRSLFRHSFRYCFFIMFHRNIGENFRFGLHFSFCIKIFHRNIVRV